MPAKPIYAPLLHATAAAPAHCSRQGAPPPHKTARPDLLLDGSSGGRSIVLAGVLAPPPCAVGSGEELEHHQSRGRGGGQQIREVSHNALAPLPCPALVVPVPAKWRSVAACLVEGRRRGTHQGSGKKGTRGRGRHRGSCRPPRQGAAPARRQGSSSTSGSVAREPSGWGVVGARRVGGRGRNTSEEEGG